MTGRPTPLLRSPKGSAIRFGVSGRRTSGSPGARNRALSVATGEFIAFLDHDDVWPREKLEVQVAAMRSNPGVGIVSGRMRVFGGALPGRPWSAQGRSRGARRRLLLGGAHSPFGLRSDRFPR